MLQCSLAECLPPCTATPTSCAAQFEKAFPNKDAQLCVGCLSGKRSIAACNILQVCGTALRLAAHLLLRTLHALPLVAVLPRLRLPALDPRHHCAKLAAAASAPLKRLLALTSKQHHAAPCCLVVSSDLIGLSSDFSFPLLRQGAGYSNLTNVEGGFQGTEPRLTRAKCAPCLHARQPPLARLQLLMLAACGGSATGIYVALLPLSGSCRVSVLQHAAAAAAAATLRLSHPAASALQRGPALGCLWNREGNLPLEQCVGVLKINIGEASVACGPTGCSAAELGLQAIVECNHAIAVAPTAHQEQRGGTHGALPLRRCAGVAKQPAGRQHTRPSCAPAQLCSANSS